MATTFHSSSSVPLTISKLCGPVSTSKPASGDASLNVSVVGSVIYRRLLKREGFGS